MTVEVSEMGGPRPGAFDREHIALPDSVPLVIPMTDMVDAAVTDTAHGRIRLLTVRLFAM